MVKNSNKVENNIENKVDSRLSKKTIMLVILDGFGFRKNVEFNGILNANMENYFDLWNSFPHTKINASGPLVGLPEGQIGSSEVGHMTLGAGRLIKQAIVRINEEVENKEFYKNEILNNGLDFVKNSKGNIHLMGLIGPGGIHSSSKHLFAFLDFYDMNINNIFGDIFIHNFLDGRDTPQKSALVYLEELEDKINSLKNKSRFHIASLCGRYYAMDRDKRWDRVEKAYNLIINSEGEKFSNYKLAVERSYENGVFDEFLKPVVLDSKSVNNNDLMVFYNFRSDRPRELTLAITGDNFKEFKVKKLDKIKFQTLTEYEPDFNVDVLYGTIFPKNTLGEIISKNKFKQLRISESEKFPHVTYFFNGLENTPFENEVQVKVDSPKVATYDLKPEMSADEVTEIVCQKISEKEFDFILLNFANSDMVGHTGDYEAVIKAMNKVDSCLGRIKEVLDENNGTLIVTADHGNCEEMKDEKNQPHTKHTYNLVPFILCDKNLKLKQDSENLSLYNVAPTILQLFGIKKPKEMEDSDSLIL